MEALPVLPFQYVTLIFIDRFHLKHFFSILEVVCPFYIEWIRISLNLDMPKGSNISRHLDEPFTRHFILEGPRTTVRACKVAL